MRFLLFLLISPVFARAASSPVEAARLAYRNGDYKEAAQMALVGASRQDPAAMDLLGDLFREGKGVRQDAETAYGWYSKAAKKDYIPSLYRIGVYKHKGYGTDPDPKAGLREVLKASALADPDSQFDDTTVDWIGYRASEREDAHALFMLAKIVQNGWGVVADAKGAAELYAAAVIKNHPLACINLGAMRLRGEGIGEDKRAALALFDKAADDGYAIALYNYGLILVRDRGPFRDLPGGRKRLEKAAEQDYPPAIKELTR